MDIKDQLQIIEDNLNEYGQCNITLEEFNYLKKQIKADAIEEVTDELLKLPKIFVDYFDYIAVARITKKLEQLKEQKLRGFG